MATKINENQLSLINEYFILIKNKFLKLYYEVTDDESKKIHEKLQNKEWILDSDFNRFSFSYLEYRESTICNKTNLYFNECSIVISFLKNGRSKMIDLCDGNLRISFGDNSYSSIDTNFDVVLRMFNDLVPIIDEELNRFLDVLCKRYNVNEITIDKYIIPEETVDVIKCVDKSEKQILAAALQTNGKLVFGLTHKDCLEHLAIDRYTIDISSSEGFGVNNASTQRGFILSDGDFVDGKIAFNLVINQCDGYVDYRSSLMNSEDMAPFYQNSYDPSTAKQLIKKRIDKGTPIMLRKGL